MFDASLRTARGSTHFRSPSAQMRRISDSTLLGSNITLAVPKKTKTMDSGIMVRYDVSIEVERLDNGKAPVLPML